MKISLASSSRRAGALILTLVIIGFVALSLSTYFLLTQGEYFSVQRSQVWNSAIVMAEAGVEDALMLINKNQGQFGQLSNWTATAAADNWDTDNQTLYQGVYNWPVTNGTIYHVHRSPDTNAGYYDVYVNSGLRGTNNGPAIVSIGTVYWNIAGPGGGSSSNGFTVSYTGNPVRKIFVQTKLDGLVKGNLSAISSVNFNGNNVTLDSFDSGDAYHSDWQTSMTYHGTNFYGIYPVNPAAASGDPDPTEPYKRKDNAYITTDGSLIDNQNANLYGYANTGPGGSVTVGASGSIGDVNWVPTQGAQAGHVLNDMNVIYPSVVLPTNFNSAITVSKLNGANAYVKGGFTFNYVITNGSGYYKITSQVKDPIYVKGTNMFLYLPSGLTFNGNAANSTMWVETNSDLTIYTGGDIDTKGNTGINNISQYAPAFAIFGLPPGVDTAGDNVSGCLNLALAGSGSIVAYVYAPQTFLHMGGSGGAYAAVGAFVVNNIQLNGNMSFHYDEALKLLGPSRGYIPAVWQEVP